MSTLPDPARRRPLRVGVRLGLIVLLPALAFSWFAGVAALDAHDRVSAAERLHHTTTLAIAVSDLVHATQVERGLSGGFVASRGASFGDKLPNARGAVDDGVAALRRALASTAGVEATLVRDIGVGLQPYDDLAARRAAVDARSVPAAQIVAGYTEQIGALLATLRRLPATSPDADVARSLTAFVMLNTAKEQMGQQRAIVNRAAAAGAFQPGDRDLALRLKARREAFVEAFLACAPAPVAEDWTRRQSEPAFVEVAKLETSIAEGGGLPPATTWWSVSTNRIEATNVAVTGFARALLTVAEEHSTTARRASLVALAALVGVLLGVGAVGVLLARGLTRPLTVVIGVLDRVADGDLRARVPFAGGDEVGRIATAVNRTLDEVSSAMTAIGASAARLVDASDTLARLSETMTENAAGTSGQAAAADHSSREVSGSVSDLAAAAEELTASIGEIARSAGDAVRLATSGAGLADSASSVMAELAHSSTEISTVTSLIASIAEQTNMLALNATIEAARAGEAGRGFAVVAGEVKDLARQTAEATDEIRSRVSGIQSDADVAVRAIAEVTDVMRRMHDTQSTIASAVEEQSTTTNEIGRTVQEAAGGIDDIARTVTGFTGTAERTSGAAAETRSAATELTHMAGDLQALVGRFRY